MTLLLAGDTGGTKTMLRLVKASTGTELQTLHQATYTSREFPDLVPMVREFLASAGKELGEKQNPEKGCFAIAGPVVNNSVKLTNLPWSLDAHRLEQELGMVAVSLINDFAAVGCGVSGLAPADLHPLQAGQFQPAAPIAIIGAGTGLGEGFLIRQEDRYQVFASEGGHADFARSEEAHV